MEVPLEVKQDLFKARIVFFLYHGISTAVLLKFQTPLNVAVEQINLFLVAQFFVSAGAAIYFFLVSGSDTGSFSHLNVSKEMQSNISKPDDQSDSNEDPLPIQPVINLTHFSSQENYVVNDLNEILLERVDSKTLLPKLHYCEECLLDQPYRTKHCDFCQRCIPKYDHHCYWIGGCVGELNHRLYWAFLLFETVTSAEYFLMFYSSLGNYSQIDEFHGIDHFEGPYFILFLMAFVSIGATFYTGALLLLHSALVASNQTTWEYMRRDTITYLQPFPQNSNPFDQGLLKNIKTIFCHQGKLKEWELPQDFRSVRSRFNLLGNQYYQCC